MYLLDTNVVSELRRPHPHPAVAGWIERVAADELFLSAVTVGEIQAGIELTREQDAVKAAELEGWLGAVLISYNVLPMNAATFREWARLKHRRSDTLMEDAMIAATAVEHRLACISHHPTAAAHDTTARTSLRLLAVLNVLFKYACARQAARASS